ncbi:GNAT family N-acetyltransferase [Kaarinaea lacus]
MIRLQNPKIPQEFENYYDLRWRLLRQPWNQPKGSEKDDYEKNAYHLLALEEIHAVGVGRIHCVESGVEDQRWQIRYMGVLPQYRGNGIGTLMLTDLEEYAIRQGAHSIELNAREQALGFYLAKAYQDVAKGPTLFGEIKHRRMIKYF